MKRETIALAAALIGLAGAQEITATAASYFTYVHYSGSDVKKNGFVGTLSGSVSFYQGLDVLSFAYDYTHLNYKGNRSNWNQNDYTFAYTTYRLYPWYLSAGYHHVASPNDGFSASGRIPFVSFGYMKRYQWNAGAFLAYSDYDRGVSAFQLQGKGGFYRWDSYYSGWYYGFDATWINLQGIKEVKASKRNYFSVGASATYFVIGNYSFSLSGWIGERLLMVDKDGFVVYNLPEKYNYGFSVSGNYYITDRLSLGAILGYSRYKETETKQDVDVFTITGAVNYSF